MDTKLSKATSQIWSANTPFGDVPSTDAVRINGAYNFLDNPRSYIEELRQSEYFYRYDPVASTCINRMVDLAITKIRNRRGFASEEEVYYYENVVGKITELLRACALEYLVAGMAIPAYTTERVMGNRLHPKLGRTRYTVPKDLWVRNPENIVLKRKPAGMGRDVYLKIPADEVYFIQNNGKRQDGIYDKASYEALVRQWPDYVKRVKAGQTTILLDTVTPILRRPRPNGDWPQPFLVPALSALKHKLRIKQMDYSIATRAIEAIRLIKAGSDKFPVLEDDGTLDDLKAQMAARNAYSNEAIYTLFANHTVNVEWVFPPLEALLSDGKYTEPNAEVFMAMGFSRVLLVGETLRSNASQTVTATLGPVATLNELREKLLEWVQVLYRDLAEANGFKNTPIPYFLPIQAADAASLAQFAIEAAKIGALSKDTVAQMFGKDYINEREQIDSESEVEDKPELFDVVYNKDITQQNTQNNTQQNNNVQQNDTQKQDDTPEE